MARDIDAERVKQVVHEFGQRSIVLDDGQIQGSGDALLPSMTATR